MKTLVNSPIEKNIVVDKSPLWRRISAEQLYGLLSRACKLFCVSSIFYK